MLSPNLVLFLHFLVLSLGGRLPNVWDGDSLCVLPCDRRTDAGPSSPVQLRGIAHRGGLGDALEGGETQNGYGNSAQARVERFPWSFAPSLYNVPVAVSGCASWCEDLQNNNA